jgi:hypothetical protein
MFNGTGSSEEGMKGTEDTQDMLSYLFSSSQPVL